MRDLARRAAAHPAAALVGANLAFALSFPACAIALRDWGPATLTGARSLLAALAFLPLALPVLRRACPGDRARFVQLGAALWLQLVLLYIGIGASQAAIGAVVVGLEPALVAAWAAVLLGERFGGWRVAGLGVGLAGSALVAGVAGGEASPGGLLCLLGTGVTFAWYTVASKPLMARYGALELTAVTGVTAAAVAIVPMAVEMAALGGVDGSEPSTWIAAAWLAIGNSVLGYALWNAALGRASASAVGATLYAQPVLGAGLSWLALREPLPATFLPGTLLVLLGLRLATRAGRVPAGGAAA